MDRAGQPRGVNPAARGLGAALFLLGWGCTPPAPNNDEPIFPANYRSSFVETRGCRNSIEHAATIRVWVNEIGADDYLTQSATLPVGTIVVKEEFAGPACDDDSVLVFWAAMKKEAAGFDPDLKDWRFQEVASPDRRVTQNGGAACITCHTDPDCQVRDLMCTEE